MKQEPFIRTRVLVAMGAALAVAVTCFIVVAVLPAPGVPLFQDALRSFLTGLGVLGIDGGARTQDGFPPRAHCAARSVLE